MPLIITFLVLIIASYTDLKRLEIPHWLSYFFLITGLLYRIQNKELLVYHFLVLPLLLIFLYFMAPADVRLIWGFSLWQPLTSLLWLILFWLIIERLTRYYQHKPKPELPAVPMFLAAYIMSQALFYFVPVTTLLYQ